MWSGIGEGVGGFLVMVGVGGVKVKEGVICCI
jgi:hypothetical protein